MYIARNTACFITLHVYVLITFPVEECVGWGACLEWQLTEAFRCYKCVIIKLGAAVEETSFVPTVLF